MNCPKCNQIIASPEWKSCPHCGYKARQCTHCLGEWLPEDAKYCPDCGRPLSTLNSTSPKGRKSNSPKSVIIENKDTPGADMTVIVGDTTFKMKFVEGGKFTMGATPEQGKEAQSDEIPAHEVQLSGFYLAEALVTQALWIEIMEENPSVFKNSSHPVEKISWIDAQTFISRLNEQTGRYFRLPTEAEWEYAARGGRKCSVNNKYSGNNEIDHVAWYEDNSSEKTAPVKKKSPNELGLYDMSGNVSEWCNDIYDSSYYAHSPHKNPQGPSPQSYDYDGLWRVIRGGSYLDDKSFCRVSKRDEQDETYSSSSIGFRLALSVNP